MFLLVSGGLKRFDLENFVACFFYGYYFVFGLMSVDPFFSH